jgi:anhydro-N-acetylmuramic acid kinase
MEKLFKDFTDGSSKTVIGILSGTSADGASTALVEVKGCGKSTELKLNNHETFPYPSALREEIFNLFNPVTSSTDLICEMNFVLGHFYAECVQNIISESNLKMNDVDLIGSHGQTIWHLPKSGKISGYPTVSTLQIGEPAVIVAKTGIPVVADFRKADVAAGGEGAPLTPYLDYILFSSTKKNRVVQNIGGIANLTYLPRNANRDNVIAFDTGPGNMVIDALISHFSQGRSHYDDDGKTALKGNTNQELLKKLLQEPYFNLPPPKTTGREHFGVSYAMNLLKQADELGLALEDVVATATSLSVESIALAYEQLLSSGHKIDEAFVSGGGYHNKALISQLGKRISPISLNPHEKLGLHGDAKEAVLFAVLANEFINNSPSNMPRVTGASKRVVLGCFHPSQ